MVFFTIQVTFFTFFNLCVCPFRYFFAYSWDIVPLLMRSIHLLVAVLIECASVVTTRGRGSLSVLKRSLNVFSMPATRGRSIVSYVP